MVKRPAAAGARRPAGGLPRATPVSAGLDPAPFKKLREALRHETHELRCMSGGAHVVLKDGKCVFSCADGLSDQRSKVPWSLDTICKLHGCTKPLVSAAFLTLVDDGRVRLSDPVRKHLRFPDQVAVKGRGGVKVSLRKAKRPPTLRHLLTMTAGLGYEDTPAYEEVMDRIRKGDIKDLAGLCDAISDVPLQAEPGSRYEYSFCTDVLGRVCEVVSGMPLDKFVEKSLLRPLGMKDTHFVVPQRKRRRVAVLYDALERPKRARASGGSHFTLTPWSHPESAPGIMSAGGGILSYEDPGMLSTARDYAKFCQMLLNGGAGANGRRVLKASTVKAMWSDALVQFSKASGRRDGRLPGWNDANGPGPDDFWDFTGCSLLHTHLVFDKKQKPSVGPPRRAKSTWMGGGGGCFWVVDAARGLASISFSQAFGGRKGGEEDGLGPRGNDASPFAVEAVDVGRAAARRKRKA